MLSHLSYLQVIWYIRSLAPMSLLFQPPQTSKRQSLSRHLFFATTSANSVVGSIYGTTVSRTLVRCSNAYANPINISSLHFGPIKLIPNGKFGAIAFRSPNLFGTIVVLVGYLPNGTVTTGEPMM